MAAPIITDILVFSVVFMITSYLLSRFKTVKRKTKAPVPNESTPPPLKALDLGIFATLSFAWKSRSTIWDDVPPYERALDFLNEQKVKLGRMYYLVNWRSARRIAIITDLEATKRLLKSRVWLNHFHEGHYLAEGMFGKTMGILFANEDYWKDARKAVITAFRETNLFNATRIEGFYLPEIELLLEKLRSQLKSSGDNNVKLSPQHLFDYPVIHAVSQILFGRRLLESDPVEGNLMNQLNLSNSLFSVGTGAVDYFPFLQYFWKFMPTGRAYFSLCRTIYHITTSERDRRVKDPNRRSSCPQDVMDSLLKTLDSQAGSCTSRFTFENLQVTIRDLIFAGSDTTNVTLQNMILFMAIHQDKQQKVYDEIDLEVGHDRWPTYDDQKRMVYTQAVLLETLRLGSILPVTIRTNNEDCTVGDLTLKKGTYMIPAYIGIHRSEDLWEDPLVFQPERFINDEGRIINTEKTLPFSCGPRACPGELNGRVALFMFTVILLREFKWELSDIHPAPSMRSVRGLTRAPAPYFVQISERMVSL